ncbi:MAG TPA: DUF6364 family protein [Thermoflexales bacterium]|nr:DUF6364 family protein [Thermoflexales bacterium]HQW34635.1 DUF6364 family protein [Thermoflexales bacterium]HQZ23126.1 DUF6364 family protein [Thermoflexales bacterium]
MQTKLTLTIEKDVIKKAKAYARKKDKSVSRIVEDYLRNVSQEKLVSTTQLNLKAPITESLVGMFEDSGKSYKTMLDEARAERGL